MNFSTTSSQKEIEGVQPSASEVQTVLLAELMNIMNLFSQEVGSDCYQETHIMSFCKLPSHAEVWSRSGFDVMPI